VHCNVTVNPFYTSLFHWYPAIVNEELSQVLRCRDPGSESWGKMLLSSPPISKLCIGSFCTYLTEDRVCPSMVGIEHADKKGVTMGDLAEKVRELERTCWREVVVDMIVADDQWDKSHDCAVCRQHRADCLCDSESLSWGRPSAILRVVGCPPVFYEKMS